MRFAALVTAAVLVLSGCYSGTQKPGPDDGRDLDFSIRQTVVVDDGGFHPDVVHARVGDAVSVTNHGARDHTLSSDSINTGTLRPNESTTVYFTASGTIDAHDRTDPSHTATIEVAAAAPSS